MIKISGIFLVNKPHLLFVFLPKWNKRNCDFFYVVHSFSWDGYYMTNSDYNLLCYWIKCLLDNCDDSNNIHLWPYFQNTNLFVILIMSTIYSRTFTSFGNILFTHKTKREFVNEIITQLIECTLNRIESNSLLILIVSIQLK